MLYDLDLIDSVVCLWNEALGYWWILIIVTLILSLIAEKTRNGWVTGISTLVLTGALYSILPLAAHGILYFIAVIGFATTMYAIFRGRDNS